MTLVVKLGSSIVAADDGSIRTGVLDSVCSQAATLRRAGEPLVMVTSGSIANGIRHFFGSDGASRFAGNIEHLRTRLSWAHFAEHLTDFIGTL